jgi:hypothetical protein
MTYTLTAEDRAALAQHHRSVQAAIAVLANRKLGVAAPPEGIGKWEGGVRVNGREIAIHAGNVQDDWRRSREPRPEERAVVAAIRSDRCFTSTAMTWISSSPCKTLIGRRR